MLWGNTCYEVVVLLSLLFKIGLHTLCCEVTVLFCEVLVYFVVWLQNQGISSYKIVKFRWFSRLKKLYYLNNSALIQTDFLHTRSLNRPCKARIS